MVTFKSSRKYKFYNFLSTAFIVLIVLVIVALVAGTLAVQLGNDQTYIATVTDKQIKRGSGENASDKYLIYTELKDGSTLVFENTDCWFKGKFNSSDFYAQIKTGRTYEFHTIGIRQPIFSMYQNILEFKEVEQ